MSAGPQTPSSRVTRAQEIRPRRGDAFAQETRHHDRGIEQDRRGDSLSMGTLKYPSNNSSMTSCRALKNDDENVDLGIDSVRVRAGSATIPAHADPATYTATLQAM